MVTDMELVWPSSQHLPSYIAALERGWSPDNVRGVAAAREELAKIHADPRGFLESMVDREAKAGPVLLPDGSTVARIPGYRRWLWDGDFCGSISFRWQPGTAELPAHCLGHIGYAVVPWKQGRGYATMARHSGWPAPVIHDDKGSRGKGSMPPMIVAGKHYVSG